MTTLRVLEVQIENPSDNTQLTKLNSNSSGDLNVIPFSSLTTFTGTVAATTLTLSNPLTYQYGGTGLNAYSQGDLIYASAANTVAKLAKNTSATRYLSNTGSNNNPAWAQVDLSTGITGTLTVPNGGTGNTTFTAYALLAAGTTATGAFQNVSGTGTLGQVLTSGGASSLPVWSNPNPGGIVVNVTGNTQAMVANTTYIANNASVEIVFTLPATFSIGDKIAVIGAGAAGWKIAQNSSQTIHFGNQNTTTGTGGSLEFTNRYDCIQLTGVAANTDLTAYPAQGNITVV